MNYHGGDIYRYQQEMTDFSSNINPLGIPDSFRKALTGDLDAVTRYPDRFYRKLTQSILDYLHLHEDDAYIVLGNGAIEVIYKTVQVLPVLKVMVAAPTFSEYRKAAELSSIPVHESVLYDSEGRLMTEQLKEMITDRCLLVLCSPNNPTGTLIPRNDLLKLLEVLKKKNGYLMVDETFIEFTDDYPQSSILQNKSENLIVIRALTKYFGMPGLRLGYGVFRDREICEKVNGVMEPWHINTFADLAGQVVLRDSKYQEDTRKWIKNERAYMMSELSNLEQYTFLPSESNFILMTSKYRTAQEIQNILLNENILIRLPVGFTGLTENQFRIAVKDRKSNDALISRLKVIT